MSSWLYRPTPVVAWGRGPFASQNVIGASGGTMRGVHLGHNYAPGLGKAKAARTARQPWIKLSGTMGDFIPNGLGGLGDDPTYIDPGSTLTPPDFAPIDTSNFLNPATLISTPPFQVTDSILPSTLTPPAGAGPTGTGIPGTQPLNPASLVAPAASLLSSIGNFFKPSTPKNVPATNYAQLPGYGGAPAPSFLAQSTIVPGTPNSAVLIGVAVAFAALGSSGGRRR
jgi:hypothetical protein